MKRKRSVQKSSSHHHEPVATVQATGPFMSPQSPASVNKSKSPSQGFVNKLLSPLRQAFSSSSSSSTSVVGHRAKSLQDTTTTTMTMMEEVVALATSENKENLVPVVLAAMQKPSPAPLQKKSKLSIDVPSASSNSGKFHSNAATLSLTSPSPVLRRHSVRRSLQFTSTNANSGGNSSLGSSSLSSSLSGSLSSCSSSGSTDKMSACFSPSLCSASSSRTSTDFFEDSFTQSSFRNLTIGSPMSAISTPMSTTSTSSGFSCFGPVSIPESPAYGEAPMPTCLNFESPSPQHHASTGSINSNGNSSDNNNKCEKFASLTLSLGQPMILSSPELAAELRTRPPTFDFTSCNTNRRNNGANKDDYYTIASRPVQSRLLKKKRKIFSEFTAGLSLPPIDPSDRETSSSSSSSEDEDNSVPEISPLADISPGIFCTDSSVFDEAHKLILPIEPMPKNADCKTISPETMMQVLRGEYGKFLIIDCRFGFEYKGGHFKSAINITDPDHLEELLFRGHTVSDIDSHVLSLRSKFNADGELLKYAFSNPKSLIIIFHCEYSQKRGPRMYRHLRHLDRMAHEHNYPELYYPNMYVLEKGYKGFWEDVCACDCAIGAEFCEPNQYVPMNDEQYSADLSSSWKHMKECWGRRKGTSRRR